MTGHLMKHRQMRWQQDTLQDQPGSRNLYEEEQTELQSESTTAWKKPI